MTILDCVSNTYCMSFSHSFFTHMLPVYIVYRTKVRVSNTQFPPSIFHHRVTKLDFSSHALFLCFFQKKQETGKVYQCHGFHMLQKCFFKPEKTAAVSFGCDCSKCYTLSWLQLFFTRRVSLIYTFVFFSQKHILEA